jgi:prolyl 4-hydroxylase
MNQNVAPTDITHLPPDLKDKLSAELRDTLEGWYGGPLILTSIYGIRKYNNGSVLRMHVDTASTHVVSAIINVDQSVRKDWPLVILDHEGRERFLLLDLWMFFSFDCLINDDVDLIPI